MGNYTDKDRAIHHAQGEVKWNVNIDDSCVWTANKIPDYWQSSLDKIQYHWNVRCYKNGECLYLTIIRLY